MTWFKRALCGSLRATVIGGDASEWPTEFEPVDISRVTCSRCLARYARISFGGVA